MLAQQISSTLWYDYCELEMTVVPIPHGQKHPTFRWKRLQWTKLHVLFNTDKENQLAWLYHLGGDGLAVICGRPSENLFTIDCDSPASLAYVKKQLAMREIQAPCVISSRGGHVYLRAREGAVQGISSGKMQDIEIKGDGELAVLPPTIHHTGHVYEWEQGTPYNIPTISIDEIDFLTDLSGNSVHLKVTVNSQRRLHDDTRRYLSHGAAYPVGTRNDALYNAARDYNYIGDDIHAAHRDLLPVARASGLSDKETLNTIESAFVGTGFSPSVKPSNSITAALKAFRQSAKWASRTANTDKKVFAALIQRRVHDSYNRENGEFRASYRELKELTGIKGWQTIRRSLERFRALGYIETRGHDKASGACIYRFSDMVIAAGNYYLVQNMHTKTTGAVRSTYCADIAHPLSKAIGITATEILNHLHTSGAATTTQIADAIGKHRTTITRHLAKLAAHNLVKKSGDSYTAIEPDTTQEIDIIRSTGTYHEQLIQKQQHDRERALFALNPILQHLLTKNKNKQEAL